jgi:hypothetical protein
MATHFSGPVVSDSGFEGAITGNVTATTGSITTLTATTVNGETISGSLVKVSETIGFAAFTDGGGASGTKNLATQIPAGARIIGMHLTALTGFAGDTSAVVIIGDGTDTDRYMTGTPSVFTTAAGGLSLGIPSGVLYHDAAKTVTVTVTSGSDFTAVNAGSMTVEYFYLT